MSTQRAVLVRLSTGEIINNNAYINATSPQQGLDADLKYYVYYQPNQIPDYDSRFFVLVTDKEMKDGTHHPDFPDYDQYLVSYSTIKRPEEDIILSVENAENEANRQVLPATKFQNITLQALGVLFRQIDGQSLKPKEKKVKRKTLKVVERYLKNEAKKEEIIAKVQNGEDPDIDDGWDKTEVSEADGVDENEN